MCETIAVNRSQSGVLHGAIAAMRLRITKRARASEPENFPAAIERLFFALKPHAFRLPLARCVDKLAVACLALIADFSSFFSLEC